MNHFVRSIATKLWRHERRKKLGSIIYKHSSNSKKYREAKALMITLAWQGFDLEIQQTNCTSYGKKKRTS